jgi:hypothetical protein
MLVPLIITPLDDFSRMRLVFFFCRICKEAHVVVDIKIEKRARFSTGLVYDEIIEGMML